MAKKKKDEEVEAIVGSDVMGIIAGMKKKFGDNVFVSGNEVISRKRKVISFSPKIDMMLGGGIPEGVIGVVTGPPKVGKTTGFLHFAGMAQRPEYDTPTGPRHVFFHNIEMRLQDRDLAGIKHLILDAERFTCIKSTPDNFLTAEKHAAIFQELVHAVPGAVFIFDSFSALCTQTRLDATVGTKFRDNYTNILSDMLTRTQPIIIMNNSIVLGVTHEVANTGGFGSNKSETGGTKVQYHSDVKLKATHRTAWRIGGSSEEDGVQIGQTVHWKCDWSALGPPGTKCDSLLRYGYGIDKEAEMIEVASDLGLITKSGSWFAFPDGTKAQGLEKARQILVDTPALYQDLNAKYRDMMGFTNEDNGLAGKDS